MDTNKLEIFLKVLECNNLTKAGEYLGYTQSGITHIINSLEKEIGFRLLKRSRSGVSLTPEGQLLLPLFREIVEVNSQINSEILKIKGLSQGTISIGAFTSIALYYLPQILREFQLLYPNINITVMKGNTSDIEKWLEEGTIDIGFLSLQDYHSFDFIPLMRDPIYAVMSPENPLVQYDPLPVSHLNEAPFLHYTASTGFDLDTEKVLKEINPKIVYTTNFDYSLISMARQNIGVCLVPGLTAENDSDGVVLRRLSPPFFRTLGISIPSFPNASPAVKTFIKCTKKGFSVSPYSLV